MTSIPSKRFNNNNWLKIHHNHCFHVDHDNINSIIIGDSIVAGLTRYSNVWKSLFGNKFINLGIRRDRVENFLWRDIVFPSRLKNVFILSGMNNINKDPPYDIVQGLIAVGSSFKYRCNNPNIFICGLLPHDEYVSVNRVIIDEINDLLSFRCSVNNFHFIDQSKGWTLDNGTLDFSLFYSDGLHLVQRGNLKLGKSILKEIASTITGSRIPSRYKNAVCSTDFNLNLEDFPTLPRTVPVRNPVSFNKSMFKVVSTSSVRPIKLICNSNIPPSKPVSASSFGASKPISNRNIRPSKTVSASSVSPGKPICGSNVSLSEHVSTIIFHTSTPIIGSNVRSSKPVSDSSVCSSKPIFRSGVCASKPIRTINVRASIPVSEHVRVTDVRPSEPTSSIHTRSSNVASASNIRPSKTVSASNFCLGNPVCTNYVRSSRAICGSKVCQSKPTSDSNIRHTDLINTSNVLPSKPIRSNCICFVNSSLPTQQILYIFLLSLLASSVFYKYSIFKMNIFITLFLVIMILLTKSIFLQNIFKKIGIVSQIFIFIFFVPVIW